MNTFRRVAVILAVLATRALGVGVGDSYDSVVAEKGKPKSQLQAGSVQILTYPDIVIKLKDNAVVSVRSNAAPAPAAPAAPSKPLTRDDRVLLIRKQMREAMGKVTLIVNQPVNGVPKTPDMKLAWFPNGWFHPGAGTPNFDTVDVRETQDTSNYAPFDYVASNLAPDVAYPAQDCEFNAALKLFYTDYSVPKKRLTESEMIEINKLYRVIGACYHQLAELGAQ